MKRIAKWVAIGVGGFIGLIVVLAIISSIVGKDKPDSQSPPASSQESAPKGKEAKFVPTPTYSPNIAGKTVTESAPYGQPVAHRNIEVTVLNVVREWQGGSSFISPDADHKWVVVTVKIRNLGPREKTESYNPLYFRVTGARGIIYNKLVTPGPLKPLRSGEFFGGGEITGDIVQQVHQDDKDLVLIYSQPLQGSRYLSLEKPK
jgi:hypothetical protein